MTTQPFDRVASEAALARSDDVRAENEAALKRSREVALRERVARAAGWTPTHLVMDAVMAIVNEATADADRAGEARGRREGRAEAWDEGFEAGSEFTAHNPGPSGIPHDPPRNPYDTDGGR